MRRTWWCAGLSAAAVLALAGCGGDDDDGGGGTSSGTLSAKSLAIGDLPTGWTVDPNLNNSGIPLPPCATDALARLTTADRNDVAFERDLNGPFLTETVSRFESGAAATALAEGVAAFLQCDGQEFNAGTTALAARVREVPLPVPAAEEAKSLAISIQGTGAMYLSTVAVLRTGDVLATVSYSDQFLLDPTTATEFIVKAASKLEN